jgi:hypothetical protein
MPSPFSGMDPFLEGYLWPDVHGALANKIRQMLVPLVRPRYSVRLAINVIEEGIPREEIGVMYPDVEVLKSAASQGQKAQISAFRSATPATLTIPLVETKVTNVEVRDTKTNQLVTSIEILSPVNKREPGLGMYRKKRQRLQQVGVHLLELDLLRRGTRPFAPERLMTASYVVALSRAYAAKTDLWTLSIEDVLPKIPVPLLPADEDVILDLGEALESIYEEAAYELSIDYQETPPPPELSEEDQLFLAQVLKS